MFDDFMNAEMLTTFAGLAGAVLIIVQFTKSIVKKRFGDSFIRIYAFIISLILTIVFGRNSFNAEGIVLSLINAMLITVTSFGGYEMMADPMAQGKRK